MERDIDYPDVTWVMLYFGYGSNLSTKYTKPYFPSARIIKRAMLPNYHIEFRKYSTNLKGGISTIMEAPGEFVEGVIYEVSEVEMAAMDVLEDVPLGLYRRDTYMVYGRDGEWERVDLYRVTTPKGPYTPSKKYVGYMLEGMREHNFEEEYIKKFQEIYDSL